MYKEEEFKAGKTIETDNSKPRLSDKAVPSLKKKKRIIFRKSSGPSKENIMDARKQTEYDTKDMLENERIKNENRIYEDFLKKMK